MYGGDFDGNAAFAGGGFMPSQATTQAHESSSSLKVSSLSLSKLSSQFEKNPFRVLCNPSSLLSCEF
jgi:hypothetical protein